MAQIAKEKLKLLMLDGNFMSRDYHGVENLSVTYSDFAQFFAEYLERNCASIGVASSKLIFYAKMWNSTQKFAEYSNKFADYSLRM